MKTNYVNRTQKLVALSVGIIGIAAIAWTQPTTPSSQKHVEIPESTHLPNYPITVLPPKPTRTIETNFITTASNTDAIKEIIVQDTIWSSLQDSTATYFQSPEWESKIAEIEKSAQSLSETAKELAAQFNSEEWQEKIKAQVEAGQVLSKEWEEKLASPEWNAKIADLKNTAKISEKMAKEFVEKFNSVEWQEKIKMQVEETERMSEELREKFDSQEWKELIKSKIEKTQKSEEEQNDKLN